MARPRKWRKVCMLPGCTSFGPHSQGSGEALVMTVDEYETIRLIDWEGLTQEQCAEQMEVARTTVQAIYAAARKKLAECLVCGHRLTIDGGEYQICEHRSHSCGQSCCRRRCGFHGKALSTASCPKPQQDSKIEKKSGDLFDE